MWRVTPGIVYNIAKRLAIGIEYEHTCVQYGTKTNADGKSLFNSDKGLYDQGIHDVTNSRVLGLIKFTF